LNSFKILKIIKEFLTKTVKKWNILPSRKSPPKVNKCPISVNLRVLSDLQSAPILKSAGVKPAEAAKASSIPVHPLSKP